MKIIHIVLFFSPVFVHPSFLFWVFFGWGRECGKKKKKKKGGGMQETPLLEEKKKKKEGEIEWDVHHFDYRLTYVNKYSFDYVCVSCGVQKGGGGMMSEGDESFCSVCGKLPNLTDQVGDKKNKKKQKKRKEKKKI